MSTIHAIELIISDPEIRRGQPVLRGTQITVSDVVNQYEAMRGAIYEVADQLRIPVDYVFAALAYFHANRDRVALNDTQTETVPGDRRQTLPDAEPEERLRLLYRELRSPLTTLAGNLEMLEKRDDFGDEYEATIDSIVQEARRSLHYIRDVVTAAQHNLSGRGENSVE